MRGDAPAPPDPDAALQPDRTLFRRGARQMVNVYGLEGQDAAATEMHPAIAHLLDSYLRGEARQFMRGGRLRSGVWHVAYYRLKPEAHDG